MASKNDSFGTIAQFGIRTVTINLNLVTQITCLKRVFFKGLIARTLRTLKLRQNRDVTMSEKKCHLKILNNIVYPIPLMRKRVCVVSLRIFHSRVRLSYSAYAVKFSAIPREC